MIKKITFFVAVLATTTASAQVTVPETTKALYNKKTASWCPPCGEWGWTTNEAIETGIGDKAVSFKLSASSSGDLYHPVCADLYDGYDTQGQTGWPNFYVNAFNETEYVGTGISPTTTQSNCISAVNNFYSATTADINAGYSVSHTANSITVDVTTKFFNAMDGDYYTAIYLLENNIPYSQDGISGTAIGDHILRASFTGNSWGDQVGSGSVSAGTTVDNSYTISMDPSWDISNLTVITVVWEDLGGGMYDVINANDVFAQAGVDEITQDIINVYPNPATDMISIETTTVLEQDIKVYNAMGTLVATVEPNANLTTLDISNLENGIYFVEVIDNNNTRSVEKVIKR